MYFVYFTGIHNITYMYIEFRDWATGDGSRNSVHWQLE